MSNKKDETIIKNNIIKRLILLFVMALVVTCTACGKNNTDTEKTEEVLENNTSSEEVTPTSDKSFDDENRDYAKEFLESYSTVLEKSDALKNSINNDDLSQTDYNLKSGELYSLWDDSLNELWNVLEKTLSKEEMDNLSTEEQAWIADKEKQIKDAGSEVEGGSMQPMLENMKGAYITEERVRGLVMLLPNVTDYIDVTGTEYEDGNPGLENSSYSEQPFKDFIENNGTVKVAANFTQNNMQLEYEFHPLVSFTLDELIDFLNDSEFVSYDEPEMQIAYLNNPDRKAYVMSFLFRTNAEPFTEFIVMSENNGQLELNYSIDGWSRRYPTFNEYGVVYDGGSNGAGAHSVSIVVPTKEFEYKVLSEENDNAAGWDFYDYESQSKAESISSIMADVLDTGNGDLTSVTFSQVFVNGVTYYYYLKDGITRDIVDDIDAIADKYDFKFDGKDKSDAAVDEYAGELNVSDIYQSNLNAEFTDFTR